jgi:hypothetical protein
MKQKPQYDELALARRIRAAGCLIYIPEDDDPAQATLTDEVKVCQTGGVIDSSVFDYAGGTGFRISLAITSLRRNFAVSHYELELPWKLGAFTWLEDPKNLVPPRQEYRFGGTNDLQFDRDLVINHELRVTHCFADGESVEGLLLGCDQGTIPDDVRHGAMIAGYLILRNQRSREFRAPIELWCNRGQRKAPIRTKRRSLFESRDLVPCK